MPLVRVGNSGISAIITPTGEVIDATKPFTRTTEIEQVSWGKTRTIYNSVGDLFAKLCLVFTVVCLAATFVPRRRMAILPATGTARHSDLKGLTRRLVPHSSEPNRARSTETERDVARFKSRPNRFNLQPTLPKTK